MRTRIAFLGTLLLAASALAGDGETCNTDQSQFTTKGGGGQIRRMWCVTALDNKGTVSGSASYVLANSPTKGLPDFLSIVVGTDEDCTLGTVTVTSSDVLGGAESTLVGCSSSTLDLSNSGTKRINCDLHGTALLGGVLNFVWTSVSGCGIRGFDVNVIGVELGSSLF